MPVPAEAAAHTLLKEQLDEVLDTLTEREEKVLAPALSAWTTAGARTLEEVGKEFDVTRERIRQESKTKALRKTPPSKQEPQAQGLSGPGAGRMGFSKRLQAVAALVTCRMYVRRIWARITPIFRYYLVEHGLIPSAFAMDINEGPLSRAREHVEENGLSDRIEACGCQTACVPFNREKPRQQYLRGWAAA